jgi:hypothetical protein
VAAIEVEGVVDIPAQSGPLLPIVTLDPRLATRSEALPA